MIMNKSEGSDPPHRSIPRYNLITAHPLVGTRVHTIGDHLSLGVDHVVGTLPARAGQPCLHHAHPDASVVRGRDLGIV